jgi:hypothetical protein
MYLEALGVKGEALPEERYSCICGPPCLAYSYMHNVGTKSPAQQHELKQKKA